MNLNLIFNSKTKSISQAVFLLFLSTLGSNFLGLIRDRLLAWRFGASENLDIYFSAFRIPDLVYGILISGGILAAFLPIFSENFKKEEKEGWKLANNLLNSLSVFLIFLSGILFIFTPKLINFIVPGFTKEQKVLTINLTRIMFLSPIFLGLSNIFSLILQYFNRFLIYSLAPIFYNLGIIFGILFFVPYFGIFGLGYGVILGALFHLLIQIPSAISCGWRPKLFFDLKDPGLRKIFQLTMPRIISSSAYHLNLIVITAIASTLSFGSISIFNFANNLQNLPIGLIGVSFAIAVFPTLAKNSAEKKKEDFISNFSLALKRILFLTLPLSFLIIIFRNLIVNLILKTGKFGPIEAKLCASALALFSLGIFAGSLIPLILRAFFALKDTLTPTLIGILALILNIFLSFYLTHLLSFQKFISKIFSLQNVEIKKIAFLGLPLAFSISTIFQFILLYFFLKRGIDRYWKKI